MVRQEVLRAGQNRSAITVLDAALQHPAPEDLCSKVLGLSTTPLKDTNIRGLTGFFEQDID